MQMESRQPASHSAFCILHWIGGHEACRTGTRTPGRRRPRRPWTCWSGSGPSCTKAEQAAQQICLILTATQECLGADAVLWHPGATGDAPEGVGASELSPAWRQEFMDHILAGPSSLSRQGRGGEGPGQVLRSFLDPAARPATPWPFSAGAGARQPVARQLAGRPELSSAPALRGGGPQADAAGPAQLLNHRQQAQVYEKLKDSLFGLVRCLTAAIDAKDPYTWGHSERMARMAVRLGRQLDMPSAVQSDLYLAGLLHDVGKIGVRDDVLQKPSRLTPEETAHIQEHPVIGDRLVCHIKALQHLRRGVRNHHGAGTAAATRTAWPAPTFRFRPASWPWPIRATP